MRWCYVHLPRFPVQRRVMETPSLAQKPLALVENVQGHLRVAFASTSALKAGVRPGMTRTAACALVPELPCFDYAPDQERAALVSLGEALLQCAPQFQLCAPDGLFLDAAAAHLFGGEEGLCRRVLEGVKLHGYRAKVAVAQEAFTARALARHGEKRACLVAEGQGAGALAPLPLGALGEVEERLVSPLRALGLSTLGEVAALPAGAVIARLGAAGLRAQRLCRGEDDTPFVAEPLAEVLEEKVDLDWPAENVEPLLFALKTLLDRICARLGGRSLAAVRLEFRLRLDPSGEAVVPLQLARPSAQAKLLLDLARNRISDLTLEKPVAGVAVKVAEASLDRGQQLPLGDAPAGDAALEVVLSRLSTTLGEEALFAAALEEAHKPEGAYAAAPFHPPERQRGVLAEVDRQVTGAKKVARAKAESSGAGQKYVHGPLQHESARPRGGPGEPAELFVHAERVEAAGPGQAEAGQGAVIPLRRAEARGSLAPEVFLPSLEGGDAETLRERPSRFFVRPSTLEAELGEEGEILSARLLGKRRRVQAVAGPERLTGEWWDEEFVRDYYRVYFEGLGPVWIYRDERDGRFYLHGMFD